jgi:cytochrome c oxidase subunit 2
MTNILIIIVVLLIIVTVVQVLRVSELLSEINNTDVNEVTDEDNNTQGKLLLFGMFLFLGFVIWQMVNWSHLILPDASSVHGEIIDGLMSFTMNLILVTFFILTPILFYFGYRYRGNKNNTAYYYVHNNKLELIWTIAPAIILTGVIIYGLQTWNLAMNPDTSNSKVIEIYSRQFDWTARYSGQDNRLGSANYRLVKGRNQLGVDLEDEYATDDIVVKEVHLIKGESVLLKFRSQDVIHSAFLPYFRVQMNCVPGMTTQFAFTPTKTTNEMRETEGEDFDYILLCNKICGAAHYNMQMKFVVETKEEYEDWITQQKTLKNTLTLK